MMFPLFHFDPTLKVQIPRRFYMSAVFYFRVKLAVAALQLADIVMEFL